MYSMSSIICIIVVILSCIATVKSFNPSKIGIHIKQTRCPIHSSSLVRKLQVRNVRENNHRLYNFKNFDEMLEQVSIPILVDFYAVWCGPCQMMQPVLEDLASRLEDQARIAKVDTDKSPRLASRYQVEALPTLILFHKGKVIEKYIGYKSADDLELLIKNYLKTVE